MYASIRNFYLVLSLCVLCNFYLFLSVVLLLISMADTVVIAEHTLSPPHPWE